jgi:hypothetical protein
VLYDVQYPTIALKNWPLRSVPRTGIKDKNNDPINNELGKRCRQRKHGESEAAARFWPMAAKNYQRYTEFSALSRATLTSHSSHTGEKTH